MLAPWVVYACVVVFGATGIHFFSKIAKGNIEPPIALVYTMAAGLLFSICFAFFSNESFVKSMSETKAIALYGAVGISICVANLGIFWMFQAGAPISIATPLVRSAPAIFAVLLGVFFFGEHLKLHHIMGMLLAGVGFFFMTKS